MPGLERGPVGCPPASARLKRVIRVDIAYDGCDFHGYARQPGLRTVQGEFEAALSTVLRGDFETRVAGRTDAGAHALAQVISIRTDSDRSAEKLLKSFTKILPDDLAVTGVADVHEGFHARYAARSRSYRYRLLVSDVADPTRRRQTWWVGPVDLAPLSEAAARFEGVHDFRAFCRKPDAGESTTRRVHSARWRRPEGETVVDEFWFEIRANSYCHQMVRRMVARCVAVARRKAPVVSPEEITDLGCKPAPAQGLYLVGVEYE